MDLITVRLAQLGDKAIVQNKEGREFLDLSNCLGVKRGYNDQWELTFNVRTTKKTTTNGKKVLAVQLPQTDEERAAKADPVYIGSGVNLFDDGVFQQKTTYKPSVEANREKSKPTPSPLPQTDDGLPF
jgi:hypothetical protein